MKVLCLSKRFSHHTTSGGYDRLAEYLGASVVARPEFTSFPLRALEKLWSYWNETSLIHPHYRMEDRIAEEKTFWNAIVGRVDIVHALYGDEQVDLLLRRIGLLRAPLVLSFHYPLERIRHVFRNVPKETLARIGGVTTVGLHDIAGLKEWLGPDKVIYAPLGVDTEIFKPIEIREPRETTRFLFVGLHMRDFEVAHTTIDRCMLAGFDAEFDVVLPADKQLFFTGCTNVRRHSNISEANLLQLYQQADALFLPLTDATSSQAVLESLSCGTPVISTNVGSLYGYVDDTCGWLLPAGDADAAFACLSAIVADRSVSESLRPAARARGKSLAWENTARPILAGYKNLLETGRFAS